MVLTFNYMSHSVVAGVQTIIAAVLNLYQCAVRQHCPLEIGSALAERVGQGERVKQHGRVGLGYKMPLVGVG